MFRLATFILLGYYQIIIKSNWKKSDMSRITTRKSIPEPSAMQRHTCPPQQTKIKQQLSDNEEQKKCFLNSSACFQTNSKPIKIERKKVQQGKQLKKRERIGSPQISYISPTKIGLGNLIDPQSKGSGEEVDAFKKAISQLNKKEIILDSDQIKDVSSFNDKEQKVRQQIKSIEEGIIEQKLRKTILSLQHEIQHLNDQLTKIKNQDQMIKQEFDQYKSQSQEKLNEQKQINRCLEDVVEQLNIKIQALLQEVKHHSDCQNQISIDGWLSTLDQQASSIEKKDEEDKKMNEFMPESLKQIDEQNFYLKQRIKDMQKNLKHFQFEASMWKRMRWELALQKRYREGYQSKNKLLTHRLKSLLQKQEKRKTKTKKQQTKAEKLEDSLSFSIQFQ